MTGLGLLEHSRLLRAAVRPRATSFDARLRTRLFGWELPHPIGLAGGFDKNALRPRALAALGFSHLEVGTVTALDQAPNPVPNLFRLPADRALVNRLGFPNEGAEVVTARLAAKGCDVPVGISIGKSRAVPIEPIEGAIADYVTSFRHAKRALETVKGFVVVNVSSPNTKDLRALQAADIAKTLLAAISAENEGDSRVPVLLKVAPDLDDAGLDALLDVVAESAIDGVVATNTTVARTGLATPAADVERIGAGGLSGPPLHARALEVVAAARKKLGPQKTIVGVGGISDGASALAMLRAGANALQIYTAFVYRGPFAAAAIAHELAIEMERAGLAALPL